MSTGAPDQRPPEEKPRRVIRIELSPSTLILLALFIPGLWVMSRILPVFLVLASALIIAGSVSPAVRFLEARSVSRNLGIAIVFSGLTVAALLFITLTIPALIAQVTNLFGQQAAMRERLAGWLEGFQLTNPLANVIRYLHVGDLVTVTVSSVLELSGNVVAIFAYILSAVFLAL